MTSELPRLHTPEAVAEALGCSTWWLKDQARKRRVPFVKVAGAYRFTGDHLAEIIRSFEQRPEHTQQTTTGGSVRRRSQPPSTTPVTQLSARRPRRSAQA
ncbi:MAG: hypothetical protein ABIQ18_47700 [Umezawaea sp.]